MSNLPAISLKQAIETLRGQHPQEIAVIEAAVRKDIVVLGTGEAFAIRGMKGEIRAFKDECTLSVVNGGIWPPFTGNAHTVSAQGYEMWAEKVGASLVFPDEIQVNGQWYPNPHPVRDAKNGMLLGYQIRARAFRFSDKGVPILVEWATYYDIAAYRAIDLFAKATKFPHAFMIYPNDMQKPTEKGRWAMYPLDESVSLAVDTSHPEGIDWYRTIKNREKKALDIAQTFCRRNAFKHLSGIQKAPGPNWTFPVLCWRPVGRDWSIAAEYLAPEKRNVRLLGIQQVLDGKPVQIIAGSDHITGEDDTDNVEIQPDPEDETDVIEVQPEAQGPPLETNHSETPKSSPSSEPAVVKESLSTEMSDEDKKIMANYVTTREMFPGEFDAACQELQLNPNAEHTVPQAVAIIGAINRALS